MARGTRRKDIDDLIDNGETGDFCFQKTKTGLTLWLKVPTSKDDTRSDSARVVRLPLTDTQGGPTWTFDGNQDAPTLSPSVRVRGMWHGFLKNGELETCADSPSNS